MVVPALLDYCHHDPDWAIFLRSCVGILMFSSLIFFATKGAVYRFTARFGFLLTVCLWATAIFLGALPFYLSHRGISFSGAIFEATSGVTTTGSTVLKGLDHFPHGLLLWRSFLCWLGGVGFIALALLIFPTLRVGGARLYSMESSNASEKILPRFHQIANGIIISYVGLTVLCLVSYFGGDMSLFDAVNHAMTTIATAGFSTHDQSLGYYHSNVLLIISILFMLLASLPFLLYVKIVLFGFSHRLKDPQVSAFLGIVFLFSFCIGLCLFFQQHVPFPQAFLRGLFHLSSLISTTGYVAEDYDSWGHTACAFLVLASFIGGCAGSTSGGLKVNRLLIFINMFSAYCTRLLSPHRVVKIRYAETEVSDETVETTLLFLGLYMLTLFLGTVGLLLMGEDFVSAFTGTLTSVANVGAAFGAHVGPSGSFSTLSDGSLWILSFVMLAGRLELISLFIIFTPVFWEP